MQKRTIILCVITANAINDSFMWCRYMIQVLVLWCFMWCMYVISFVYLPRDSRCKLA